MNSLRLYNTETREKDPVVPLDGKKIRMYTCGPTVYDFAHIGNFRTYVFEDLLRRTLLFFGFQVEQAMNLTDVDDKTIRGAIREKLSLREYTEPFKKAFFEDLKTLNIQPIEHYPAATDYLPEMIRLIETLLKKECAYQSQNKSIYFKIRQFPSYGRLSHFTLDQLQENASGENEADEYDKDNIADFVLWKAYDPERDGTIFWDSPFGPGRPGWHIECSAMAMKILGDEIDIHCGGIDNMFPHHENEIAQSECCSGKRFVRHWLHSEHLLVDHKKMSKSLHNFYTLRDLLKKGFNSSSIRYLLLSTHYRTQLNFTLAGLDGAKAALTRIRDLIVRLSELKDPHTTGAAKTALEQANGRFCAALADDLNISVALASLFDLIREVNALCDDKRLGARDAEEILALFKRWDSVLGVLPFEEGQIPPELADLLAQREEARRSRNFRLSDELRDVIHEKGYLIEDTPQGARLKKQ